MRFLTLIIISIFLTACSSGRMNTSGVATITPTSTYSGFSLNSEKNNYTIRRGDSLWAISRRYGVSVNEICEINKIANYRDLKIGQVIVIPRRQYSFSGGDMAWPVNGEIVSFYGEKLKNITNNGIDIKTSESDSKVMAAMSGRVVFSDYLRGWGKTVILKHSGNLYTIYANLSDILVKEGDTLTSGQKLAGLGTCSALGCDFHFEVRKGYQPCDPLVYLNRKNKG
ncbi:MAG: peptidoglycan DD-metalloendopeptidase family protein [Candidatus Omnitrophica bacterium]|jgi:murein DD-endopeptidase MepM/ murein hydrolase activator NlpD|nr:peptidoglycan DD-metalloendopeptidase family protein [Candidatus Omnitrophota bacterium]